MSRPPVLGRRNQRARRWATGPWIERHERVGTQPPQPTVPAAAWPHTRDLDPNKPRPCHPPRNFHACAVRLHQHPALRRCRRLQTEPEEVRGIPQRRISRHRRRVRPHLVLRKGGDSGRKQRVPKRQRGQYSKGHEDEQHDRQRDAAPHHGTVAWAPRPPTPWAATVHTRSSATMRNPRPPGALSGAATGWIIPHAPLHG